MFDDLILSIRSWYKSNDFIPLHEPHFGKLDREYVMDAIDSTYVSSVGQYVDRFEKELAEFVSSKRAIVTVNGTSALQVALRLVGVKADDEVITQSLTFIATANAIVYNGAYPIFLDVDIDTMGLSPFSLKAFLDKYAEKRDNGTYNKVSGKRISAIVPMHTLGHPCRITELILIADNWGLPVVEDSAEALGSLYNGKHCGTFGAIGIFSFNGNKTITCGGGGAIITNDDLLADRAKHLTTTAKVNHSWEYVHDEIGYNFRLPNLNAALGCAQLKSLKSFLDDKRILANLYANFFSNIEWGNFIYEPHNCKSNYWLNGIVLHDQTSQISFLKTCNEAGIMTRPFWQLISSLNMFKNCQTDSLKNSNWLHQRVVNLPSSPIRKFNE